MFSRGARTNEQRHKACIACVCRTDHRGGAASCGRRQNFRASRCAGKGKCRLARAAQPPRNTQGSEAATAPGGFGLRSGARRAAAIGGPGQHGRRSQLCRPATGECTALRDQRNGFVPAAGRRQSRIRHADQSFAAGDAALAKSVAQTELRAILQPRRPLHGRRVQRYPVVLDAPAQYRDGLVLCFADGDGGTALSDRAGIGLVQERLRFGENRL
jgi:hypothetical protein